MQEQQFCPKAPFCPFVSTILQRLAKGAVPELREDRVPAVTTYELDSQDGESLEASTPPGDLPVSQDEDSPREDRSCSQSPKLEMELLQVLVEIDENKGRLDKMMWESIKGYHQSATCRLGQGF